MEKQTEQQSQNSFKIYTIYIILQDTMEVRNNTIAYYCWKVSFFNDMYHNL